MFNYLQKTVRMEITAGVLIAGIFLAGLSWFMLYTQEQTDSFQNYLTAGVSYEGY